MALVEIKETGNIESVLEKIPLEFRRRTLRKAVVAGGRVVAKKARNLAPVGDLEHKPDKDPLRKTIAVKGVVYRDQIFLAVVGPTWPEGNHGHLNEEGHKVVVSRGERKGQSPLTGSAKVKGKKFMAPAIDTTEAEQEKAVIETIVKDIVKLGG